MSALTTTDAIASPQADPAVAELDATRRVYEMLKILSCEAQVRVLTHVSGLLNINGIVHPSRQQARSNGAQEEEAELQREQEAAPKYPTFADLYGAAGPRSGAQKALLAGYWLQVCQGTASFDGFSANKALKHLNEGVGNITVALDRLKNQSPPLALQVSKSGRTRQARKTYKLTSAGIRSVEDMIDE
jgi:hypothetical protein